MKSSSRLEQLRLTIHGVKAPFFCAGTHAPKRAPGIRVKDGARFAVERAEDCAAQGAALKPLIHRCRAATFGDQRRNRLDRNVRDAVQLKAESGDFVVEDFDLESTGIVDAIRRELLPPGSPPIRAELYALNVYASGGHFAPHKDTPRGEDMFGSLVICLPSLFWRGQLKLSHQGVVQQFDWGQDIRNQSEATKLHWAAFYGDVDHQIERVGAGARVTLTYLLRWTNRSLPTRTIAAEDLAPAIQQAWRGLLDDVSCMPKGGLIGYPCCHLYHQDVRFQIKQKPLDQQTSTMLKGRDQMVAVTALQAGLDVTFAPYLFENCVDETWQLDRFPTQEEKRKLKSQMDLSDLESALPIVGESSEKAGGFGVTWLDEPPSDGGDDGDAVHSPNSPAANRMHSCEYCEWGYFGNEASDVDFYIYAALHIRIPPLGGRARGTAPATRTPAERQAAKSEGNRRPAKNTEKASKKSAAAPNEKSVPPRKKPTSKTPRKKPR